MLYVTQSEGSILAVREVLAVQGARELSVAPLEVPLRAAISYFSFLSLSIVFSTPAVKAV